MRYAASYFEWTRKQSYSGRVESRWKSHNEAAIRLTLSPANVEQCRACDKAEALGPRSPYIKFLAHIASMYSVFV